MGVFVALVDETVSVTAPGWPSPPGNGCTQDVSEGAWPCVPIRLYLQNQTMGWI